MLRRETVTLRGVPRLATRRLQPGRTALLDGAVAFNLAASIHSALDTLVNKFHIILGTGCQAAVLFYAFRYHKDLGPGIVKTVNAFYAFLAGHALTYQKWPDQSGVVPPTAAVAPLAQPDARLPRI